MFDLHIPRRVMTLFLLIDSSGSMSINGNMGRRTEIRGPVCR